MACVVVSLGIIFQIPLGHLSSDFIISISLCLSSDPANSLGTGTWYSTWGGASRGHLPHGPTVVKAIRDRQEAVGSRSLHCYSQRGLRHRARVTDVGVMPGMVFHTLTSQAASESSIDEYIKNFWKNRIKRRALFNGTHLGIHAVFPRYTFSMTFFF